MLRPLGLGLFTFALFTTSAIADGYYEAALATSQSLEPTADVQSITPLAQAPGTRSYAAQPVAAPSFCMAEAGAFEPTWIAQFIGISRRLR